MSNSKKTGPVRIGTIFQGLGVVPQDVMNALTFLAGVYGGPRAAIFEAVTRHADVLRNQKELDLAELPPNVRRYYAAALAQADANNAALSAAREIDSLEGRRAYRFAVLVGIWEGLREAMVNEQITFEDIQRGSC